MESTEEKHKGWILELTCGELDEILLGNINIQQCKECDSLIVFYFEQCMGIGFYRFGDGRWLMR